MPEATQMRILVSAGDPSGDLILARVVREFKLLHPTAEFFGLCGPESVKAGVRPIANTNDVAVVGITEVLFNLQKIFGVLELLKQALEGADLLLCVDFPDFNLKLAGIAHKKKVPVDYIIAPQVWAWRASRIHKIKKLLRTLYVALPFEEQYFRERGVNARFLGHPIRDLLPAKNRSGAREQLGLKDSDFALVMMPGSRSSEIKVQLPVMLGALEWLKTRQQRYRFKVAPRDWVAVLPLAPGWDLARLKVNVDSRSFERVEALVATKKLLVLPDSRIALSAADFAWIASGTATLEAALYQVPHILCYRLSGFTARLIVASSDYFSKTGAAVGLPNILLGKKVIPELLQGEFNAKRLAVECAELLNNPSALYSMKSDLQKLPELLGETGACRRIAEDLGSRL